MMRRKWVTGKALKTLIGLRAMQEGDEILVSYSKLAYTAFNSSMKRTLAVVQGFGVSSKTFRDPVVDDRYRQVEFPVLVAKVTKGIYKGEVVDVEFCEIRAWRPRKAAKNA